MGSRKTDKSLQRSKKNGMEKETRVKESQPNTAQSWLAVFSLSLPVKQVLLT